MDLKGKIITDIMNRMQGELTNEQCDKLKNTLDIILYEVKVEQATYEVAQSDGYMESNERILRQYFGTLMIEGKSPKTIERYRLAIRYQPTDAIILSIL